MNGPRRRLQRIGIWGHYHGANQGDDLVMRALVTHIRSRLPGAELVGFSLNPADMAERHGIPAFPIKPIIGGPRPTDGSLREQLRARCVRNRWTRKGLSGLRRILFVLRSYLRLRQVDLLLVAGSGQLLDA